MNVQVSSPFNGALVKSELGSMQALESIRGHLVMSSVMVYQ